MSLNVKVLIPELGLTKVLRFSEQMSVYEVCKQIQEKVTVGGADHGLFQPSISPEKDGFLGKWLKRERSLEFYDIKSGDLLEYKKKSDTIKIKLVDDTVKKMLFDLSLPVSDITLEIGKKISLKNPEEFALQVSVNEKAQWLKPTLALAEQVTSLDQLFLLKKKFFMNDANVDQEDPVQLHLVYVQSRDDVLQGLHPITKDEAVQFAALHLQIQHGDYKPEIHKPGWLQAKDYMPDEWAKKDLEKSVYENWKKLVGMTEINTRFRYVQLCRSLRTYGMTIFKVKEKMKDKKKLTDALLCFTRDSIIRMDFESRKIIKEHSFKHLMRWAATPETFTLDFGSWEEEYIVVLTQEGEAISNLLAGYIDLMLKKHRDTGIVIEEDEGDVANVSNIARVGGAVATSMTTSTTGSDPNSYSSGVVDAATAAKAIEKMINDLFGEVAAVNDSNLTPQQRQQQIALQAKNLLQLAETLENFAKTADRTAMNAAAHKITAAVEQLILASRQAAATGADPNKILLNASKGVSDALKALLAASANAANKPNDPEAKDALLRAQAATQAAIQKLIAASKGIYGDEGYQTLLKDMARIVDAEARDMIQTAERALPSIVDTIKRQQLTAVKDDLSAQDAHFLKMVETLAPTAQDVNCKSLLERSGKGLDQTAAFVVATAKTSGLDPKTLQSLSDAQRRIAQALNDLLSATDLPNVGGAQESEEFTEAAQNMLSNLAALMANEGNPALIKQHSGEVKNAVTKLGASGKGIIIGQSDPATRERITNNLKAVVEATKHLLEASAAAITNPNDEKAQAKLKKHAAEVSEIVNQLFADTGKQVALASLFNAAKDAAATTSRLTASARSAQPKITDQTNKAALDEAAKKASEALKNLLLALKTSSPTSEISGGPSRRSTFVRRRTTLTEGIKDDIMKGTETFAPVAYKLVSASKQSTATMLDGEEKQDLIHHSNYAAKAIQKMLTTRKALKVVKSQLELAEALEAFKAAQADLESAFISADTGILQATKSRDEALPALGKAIEELALVSKQMATAAKSAPEDLGGVMKSAAKVAQSLVAESTALAASVNDKILQKAILANAQEAIKSVGSLMQISKALSINPEDPNFNKLILSASKSVADALGRLTEASKGVIPKKVEEFQSKASQDIEDLAEKELKGAAAVIEKCVMKLTAATEQARQRANEKGIDIDEQNITEAILEAAQAIAKSTAVLVSNATAVQQEFQKLVTNPQTGNVYRRDPQWAQGLISAARTVAGAVQHLVKAANDAAQGNASEEALIVAAQAVSASTTQLVTASTVKAPNSINQGKLKDASSMVAKATSQLVEAAKKAAQWEKEKEQLEQEEKFNLTDDKIREMEKQMEILRLEKMLQDARSGLATMRKTNYQKDVNPDFKPANTAPTTAVSPTATAITSNPSATTTKSTTTSPAPATGTAVKRTLPAPATKQTGGVAWKQNTGFAKPQQQQPVSPQPVNK